MFIIYFFFIIIIHHYLFHSFKIKIYILLTLKCFYLLILLFHFKFINILNKNLISTLLFFIFIF